MARLALGVDFGGTKVLASVVDVETGNVLGTAKKKSDSSDGPDEAMQRIFEVAAKAAGKAKVEYGDLEGICVGIAGQVDAERGILLGTANLSRSTVNLPMAELLQQELGIPAILRNDVQIAAAGEAAYGAGRDVEDFVVVFVGTGIGGGIVRHGEIVAGSAGSAGEIGHTTVQVGGRICGCGGKGHLEAYASRTGMTRAILGEIRRGRKSVLSEMMPDLDPADPTIPPMKSGLLREALKQGDEVVHDVVTEAGMYLGYGLANVVNFLNPTMIILGGGVIESVQELFDAADRSTRREALPNPGKLVRIERAGLGDFSGVVGAAVLAARTAPAPAAPTAAAAEAAAAEADNEPG